MVASNEPEKKIERKTHTLAKVMIPKRYRNPVSKYISVVEELMQEYWKRIWLVTLWVIISLGLFYWKWYENHSNKLYEISGECLTVAKGSAEALKFNMALILLPVCRTTLTKLRSTFLYKAVPFDENINFHKLIAAAIVFWTVLHTLAHVICNYPRLAMCPRDEFMAVVGKTFNYKQPTYLDLLTCTVGWTGIVMILIMALSFTLATSYFRRNVVKLPYPFSNLAGFNSFWYTHHLLALAYVFLIMHGTMLIVPKPWYLKTVCTCVCCVYAYQLISSAKLLNLIKAFHFLFPFLL